MGKNNNKIKLSEEEAIKAITDLDGIVIQSIQKSYFAGEAESQKHDKASINEKVNETMA